jgi:hypothetical protein
MTIPMTARVEDGKTDPIDGVAVGATRLIDCVIGFSRNVCELRLLMI